MFRAGLLLLPSEHSTSPSCPASVVPERMGKTLNGFLQKGPGVSYLLGFRVLGLRV